MASPYARDGWPHPLRKHAIFYEADLWQLHALLEITVLGSDEKKTATRLPSLAKAAPGMFGYLWWVAIPAFVNLPALMRSILWTVGEGGRYE